MRKGFTLIELIVVVIVVGILATIAIPQYLRATERAKGAKARSALGLVAGAEKQARADTDLYVSTSDASLVADLGTYTEMDSIANDPDWDYDVAAVGGASFTATATRVGGGTNAGETISLTDAGVWGGDFTP